MEPQQIAEVWRLIALGTIESRTTSLRQVADTLCLDAEPWEDLVATMLCECADAIDTAAKRLGDKEKP